MQVPVDVDLEAMSDAVGMQRDVAQDELICEDSNAIQRIESDVTIVLVLEDVVVAANQTLLTVQPLDQM